MITEHNSSADYFNATISAIMPFLQNWQKRTFENISSFTVFCQKYTFSTLDINSRPNAWNGDYLFLHPTRQA